MVKGKYVDMILKGEKTATIRKGVVKPKYKEIIIHGGGRPIAKVSIEKVYHKKLKDLTDEEAIKDGFKNKEELVNELRKVYPDLRDDDYITVIEFRLIQRLDHLSTEDPYLGLTPADIARIALRYLTNELTEQEKKILLDLTRTNSIRATALRLFGSINNRLLVRRTLRKATQKLIEKGILKKRRD